MGRDRRRNFRMTEPAEHGTDTKYAFRLTTSNDMLFDFVQTLLCVSAVNMMGNDTALVDIDNRFDADEAWHYIRSELEHESRHIKLDAIWEDALKWL